MADYVTSTYKPYGLHRARVYSDFTQEKLIGPSMFGKPSFALDSRKLFVGMSYNIITPKEGTDLFFILGLLNSSWAEKWFYGNAKHRGVGVDVGVDKLRDFPIPSPSATKQKAISDKVRELVRLKESKPQSDCSCLEDEIDKLVEGLF